MVTTSIHELIRYGVIRRLSGHALSTSKTRGRYIDVYFYGRAAYFFAYLPIL